MAEQNFNTRPKNIVGNFFNRIFSLNENVSYSELIESKRRAQRLTLIATALYPILTSIFYISSILSSFIPADLTNTAVRYFLASDTYQSTTSEFFNKLERYNHRLTEEEYSMPPQLVSLAYGVRGVVVLAQLNLRLAESSEGMTPQNSHRLKEFAYESTYTIRLDEYYLMLYVLAMVVELALFSYCYQQIRSGYQRDDTILLQLAEWKRMANIEKETSSEDVAEKIIALLNRFHIYAKAASATQTVDGVTFQKEIEVQRAVRAILKLHFDDVRREECVPSFAGSNSRIDLYLRDKKIGVEIKMAHPDNRDREIGEQLLSDIVKYAEHPKCEVLICFVYDPREILQNPQGLINNLEEQSKENGLQVRAVIIPM